MGQFWCYFGAILGQLLGSFVAILGQFWGSFWAPLTDGGPDERGGVPQVVQALLLDELCHGWGEALEMSLDVVLEDQPAQGARGLVWGGKGGLWGGLEVPQVAAEGAATPQSPRDPQTPPTFGFEACEHEDQIIVEIWELVQLLQLLWGG